MSIILSKKRLSTLDNIQASLQLIESIALLISESKQDAALVSPLLLEIHADLQVDINRLVGGKK